MEITKSEAVGKLVALAKEVDIKEPIDWNALQISEDHAYDLMANSVIDQMNTVPDDYKVSIMMATMVKLLVENLVLNVNLQKEKKNNATSTNRNRK